MKSCWKPFCVSSCHLLKRIRYGPAGCPSSYQTLLCVEGSPSLDKLSNDNVHICCWSLKLCPKLLCVLLEEKENHLPHIVVNFGTCWILIINYLCYWTLKGASFELSRQYSVIIVAMGRNVDSNQAQKPEW